MDTDLLHKIVIYQKSYFEIIYDFFIKFVGKEPNEFNDFEEVGLYLKETYYNNKNNMAFLSYKEKVREELEENLTKLYSSESAQVFKSAQDLELFKINLGGSSRFLKTQLNSVRKSLLLTDIVLIPDPILPWIEKERSEEKFKNLRMIEAIYFVLHLKDLLEEEFEVPPFFIFPSWEKLLEDKDEQTNENLHRLLFDFLNFYLKSEIESEKDLIRYLSKYPSDFIRNVEEKRLFIPPNGLESTNLKDAILNYKEFAYEHRTKEWCEKNLKSDFHIVVNGIAERLVPQYHLFENSKEMKSNPYLCIPEHAHYYNLIAKMSWSSKEDEICDPQTQALLQVLSSQRLDYLANINDNEIKILRKSDEHILFKNDMRTFINSLGSSKIEDINYIAREFSDFLSIRTKQHINEIEELKRKYRTKHFQTLLLAGSTLAVNFIPLFGQLLSVFGVGSVGVKYLNDKSEEQYDLRKANSAYMGVIALAKQRN